MTYSEYVKKMIGKKGVMSYQKFGVTMLYRDSYQEEILSAITEVHEDFIVICHTLPPPRKPREHVIPLNLLTIELL